MTSCSKVDHTIVEEDGEGFRLANMLSNYPDEITIENWEAFVLAPQEVIDFYNKKEIEALKVKEEVKSDEEGANRDFVHGRVGAYQNNILRPLSGVEMESPCSFDITDTNGGYWTNNACPQVCATYDSPNNTPLNGVTTLDLVLVRRHILQITPFTEVRQEIAADITRNGIIDNDDIWEMRMLILGMIANWTTSQILTFLPREEYIEAQTLMPGLDVFELTAYGNYPPCSSTSDTYRIVVKTGDVNDTFDF